MKFQFDGRRAIHSIWNIQFHWSLQSGTKTFMQVNYHNQKKPGEPRNPTEVLALDGLHYSDHRLTATNHVNLSKAAMIRHYQLSKLRFEAKLFQRQAIRAYLLYETVGANDVQKKKTSLSPSEIRQLRTNREYIIEIFYLRDMS